MDARPIPLVPVITEAHWAMAGSPADVIGSGGMRTKLEGARIAQAGGCAVVIMRGLDPRTTDGPIVRLEAGALHTFFPATQSRIASRKAWIAGHQMVQGRITLDSGALRALQQQRSLLPSGVTAVEGDFERGDLVEIVDALGAVFGQGLISYNTHDARKIAGCQTSQIAQRLGYPGRSTMMHRDDIVMRSVPLKKP